MTNPTKNVCCTRVSWLAGLAVLLASIGSLNAQVDVQYVTTFVGSSLTPSPTYQTITGSISGSGSTEITAAPGAPSRTRARYGFALDANGQLSWSIQPTLLRDGAVYEIDVAHNSTNTAATSCSQNVVVTLTSTDGDLSASCTNTPYFQRQYGGSNWWKIGYITNYPGVTQPTIVFSYVSGTVDSSPDRVYIDAFRFTEVNPCTGVAPQVTVTGPLQANQVFVNVGGIDAGSTNISIFADGTFIGQKTAGIVAGSNAVPVSALAFGQQITATQTKNGCTSPLPSSGPIVGGGPNPSVNVFLSCWSNSAYAGPVGTNSSIPASGVYYVLKADGLTGGSQSAPHGGQQLVPGQCWQTVTFQHGVDSALRLDNGAVITQYDPFAALDALIFSIDTSAAPDSGPYDIYVDQIMNGDTVIEDFEAYAVGSVSRLNNPNAQGQFPNPAVTYLSYPNSSTISTNSAYAGTKSCRLQWQWADTQDVRWARIQFNATAGKAFPQIDTSKPITVRYLLLPVGQSGDAMHFSTAPAAQSKLVGQTATFIVAVAGTGPFTYQWSKDGNNLSDGGNISGAGTSSLTVANLAVSDSGAYNVLVNQQGGLSCSGSIGATLSVSQSLPPSSLSYSWASPNLTLNWTAGVLQSNITLLTTNNIWTDVPNATSPFQVTPAGTQSYYRLRGQ